MSHYVKELRRHLPASPSYNKMDHCMHWALTFCPEYIIVSYGEKGRWLFACYSGWLEVTFPGDGDSVDLQQRACCLAACCYICRKVC